MFIQMDNNPTTYVYDGVEVTKTARTASKSLSSGKRDILVEITPVSSFTGNWKKWIREIDLYEINPVIEPNKPTPRANKFLEDAHDEE
jgi:hypothetical protein